jgi:putative transposase
MARIAGVVVPGLPHHVTQRGDRLEPVFFAVDDYRLYRRLVAAAVRRAGAAVWAYCLMPNHIHLPIMPT